MELKEARKRARYSQETVAGILGISRPTYAKMENDPDIVTIEDAKTLSKLFNVDVSEIFFGTDYKETYSSRSADLAPDDQEA